MANVTIEAGYDYHGTAGYWVLVNGQPNTIVLYKPLAEEIAERMRHTTYCGRTATNRDPGCQTCFDRGL